MDKVWILANCSADGHETGICGVYLSKEIAVRALKELIEERYDYEDGDSLEFCIYDILPNDTAFRCEGEAVDSAIRRNTISYYAIKTRPIIVDENGEAI